MLRIRLHEIFRSIIALSLVMLASQSGRAQDEDVVRIGVNLVQLNVGVTDRRGHPVTDLSPEEFVVYEDGVPQRIVSFEPTTTPFSLVLLLDVSGSTLNFRTTLKQAALRFIDALAPDDRVAVVAFNDHTKLLTNFTSDRKKIAWAIERAEGHGETMLYRALGYALELLAKEGKRRKAIVVLTDGLDTELRNLDRTAVADAQSEEEALARVKPEANALLKGVLDAIDHQGVTIYPLALASGDPRRLPITTPQIMAIYSAARARLQLLADRSGGRLHQINRLEDLGRLYAEVAADLRTLYSIAYQPSGDRPRDGSWRSIRVEIKRPDLIARTKQGYYAR